MPYMDTTKNNFLDQFFADYGAAGSLWLVAYTATGNEDGTGSFTEVPNANGYARVAMTTASFAAASASAGVSSRANGGTIAFPAASGGDWGTVVGVGLVDSATYGAGNLRAFSTFSGVAVNDGNTLQFTIGNLTLSFD